MSHKIEEVANLGYDTASDSSRPQVDDGRKEEEMVHRHQVPVTKPMQVSKHPDKIESADTCSKREVKINTLCHYHKQPTVSSDNFIVPSADYSFPDYPPPPPLYSATVTTAECRYFGYVIRPQVQKPRPLT